MTALALLALAAAIVFLVISIREHAARVRMQTRIDALGGLERAREQTQAEIARARQEHESWKQAQIDALNAKRHAALQAIDDDRHAHETWKQAEVDALATTTRQLRQDIQDATRDRAGARQELDAVRRELAEAERALDVYEVGLYRNHYSYDTADEYRRRLDQVRERQKRLVQDDEAVRCARTWSVGGSEREGEKMMRQKLRLMLRAFNGECDAAVAKVRWDNVTTMEERIRRAYTAINKAGEVTAMSLTVEYLEARLAELRLAHEHAEKVQEEREEQRRIKEQMREEERARKELERAQEEAEQEERQYERALAKAREQLERSSGAAQAALEEKVKALELQLAEAHTQKERAISRAQQTRSGHVYVISNIGSFGEGIFKIGMTRRLDPMDRVKELGDASVPFEFDVHAIVWSDDAPGLECELHQHFAERRVNLVNPRKEFFRVSIEDIEAFATRKRLELKLTKLAEAREWRETAARKSVDAGAGVEHGVKVIA